MAELQPFKDLYSPQSVGRLGQYIKKVYPQFQKDKFENVVFDKGWKEKELKQRMRHITVSLHQFLPANFKESSAVLIDCVLQMRKEGIESLGIEFLSLPDYVEVYGLGDLKSSVKALEIITQFITCEFAVRPFIIKYGDKMLQQIDAWSKHPNHKVRRFASEGCRPRLPWGMALPALKKDPSPILPILERLKDDEHEWVRLSVANNLNDISKDNPDTVLKLFKKWHGKSKNADWVIKHASRTLLKQGNTVLMKLFGFGDDGSILHNDFKLETPKVKDGGELVFSFAVTNASKKPQMVRLEYGMHYLRANGTHSKKVFKISERECKPGEVIVITRKQSFRPITTRVYYPGRQKVSLIVNGKERAIADFELKG